MFLADLHTHSLCSPDASSSMADMARGAQAAGVSLLCITDHCDLLDLNGVFSAEYDWAPCRREWASARAALSAGLELRLGIELGEAYEDPAAARTILDAGPELDFVIGSVHNFHGMMGKQDFYNADYTRREVCVAALEDYLSSMTMLAALDDCYDTLAHILYPLRYMRRAGQDISLAEGDFPERLDVILKEVAGRGKALELNTWRGRTVDEWGPILRRFLELGGEYVTVGSDAHTPGDVGKGVAETYALMRACGCRYTAVYRGRKPCMEAI